MLMASPLGLAMCIRREGLVPCLSLFCHHFLTYAVAVCASRASGDYFTLVETGRRTEETH